MQRTFTTDDVTIREVRPTSVAIMISTDDAGRPVALVTGGGGDIGRAIALRLARDCKAVAVVDIDEGAAAQTAHLVEAAGCKSMAIRADVSDPGQSARFVDVTEAAFGPIGIFANNAGIEGVVARCTNTRMMPSTACCR